MTQDNSSEQLVERLREALEKCRDKFAEYVKLHRAKLLPERAADEFYQNARTAHNAEVREKVARNQEMVDLCDQALANPATGDDGLRKVIERALAHRYGDWTAILEDALASSPAEPREASGYCPFCMTADPVAPAEGDEPSEAMKALSLADQALTFYRMEAPLPCQTPLTERALKAVRAALSQRKAEPDAEGERKC